MIDPLSFVMGVIAGMLVLVLVLGVLAIAWIAGGGHLRATKGGYSPQPGKKPSPPRTGSGVKPKPYHTIGDQP